MRQKYSPVILQQLGGPPQHDYEYEKRLQDFKEGKNRMITLKKVIDNFPKKLEGYKEILDTIVGTCDYVFDKNQKGYCQFMHNITSAHKALTNKLIGLFNQFGQLRNSTNNWVKEINEVAAKCRQREECKKNYVHYENKLYELNTDRMKEIKKKNKISESDHERFIRNIGKFQKAGKEYIYASNSAFRSMEQFLNIRYDRIVNAMVTFVEAERSFYNEASHIMNFFINVRNNAMGLKKTLIPLSTKYEASNFIKGRGIINMSEEDIFSSRYRPPPPPTNYGPGNNPAPGPGQSYNSNLQNKGIINPFSADSNDLDNNYMNNNFGRVNTVSYKNNGFNNQSTRDTFALNNPYNTQANPYSGAPNDNNINNNNFSSGNNFGSQNNFVSNNNNFNNPYDGNNMQNNNLNPYGDDEDDPFGPNNNQENFGNNNFDGNNGKNPYGDIGNNNNNINNPYGNDDFNLTKDNNDINKGNLGNNGNRPNNNNENNNNNNNNNIDNNGDEDPFDF